MGIVGSDGNIIQKLMRKNMNLLYLFLIVLIFAIIWGLYSYHAGIHYVSPEDYDSRRNGISAREALEIAEPYLEKSLELRRAEKWREGLGTGTAQDYVFRNNKWYYIFRDDYPYKAPLAIGNIKTSPNIIKIDIKTGEVFPPSNP